MHGWPSSAASGPLTSMLSNVTSTAWGIPETISQHQRKRTQSEKDAAPSAKRGKEKRNENQSDHPIRRRPGQSPTLLYRDTGLCQEDRLQSGPISLADRGLARGARRHRTAARAEQQSPSQGISTGDLSTEPAGGHVLH